MMMEPKTFTEIMVDPMDGTRGVNPVLERDTIENITKNMLVSDLTPTVVLKAYSEKYFKLSTRGQRKPTQ